MLKKIFPILKKIAFWIFFISPIVAFGIDSQYRFDIEDTDWGYNIALVAYIYFSAYIAILLTLLILKIKSRLIKLLIFLSLLAINFAIVINIDNINPHGFAAALFLVAFFVIFLCPIFLWFYSIYRHKKFILITFSAFVLFSIIYSIFGDSSSNKKIPRPTPSPYVATYTPTFLLQPWQLNSRYKIDKIVKFLKTDLDKDGKDEIAAITSNTKFPDTVFYYAGFYRYNPATEVWDEFYSDELNILNYGVVKKSYPENDYLENSKKIIELWSNEFTHLKNIGDITGDDCPEIVFSSLVQGKYFDNNIIVAQSGQSHFRYKIFADMNTFAEIIAEDGYLIEKYYDDKYDIKEIFEWDKDKLKFKLIDTQKIISPEASPSGKTLPGFEELSG